MKLQKCFEIHEKLAERLGHDLVVSLAIVKGEYIVTISTHHSEEQEFKHGKHMQRAILSNADLTRSVDAVVDELERLLKDALQARTDTAMSLEEMEQSDKDFAEKANNEFAANEVANVTKILNAP